MESRLGSPTDSGKELHGSGDGGQGFGFTSRWKYGTHPSFLPLATFGFMLTWGKSVAPSKSAPLFLQHCGFSVEVGCPRSGKEAKSLRGLLRTQLEVARLADKEQLADNVQLREVFFGLFFLLPAPGNSLFFSLQQLLAI